MQLRRADVHDISTIAELFRASFGSIGFPPMLHTATEDRDFFGGLVTERETWVAEARGELLGFAVLGEDVLEHLYVRPDAQGRGVGRELLRHAQERRPGGFTFWVFQRNERARRFYERHGCVLVRTTDGSGNEEREPDALYEWRPRTTSSRTVA